MSRQQSKSKSVRLKYRKGANQGWLKRVRKDLAEQKKEKKRGR